MPNVLLTSKCVRSCPYCFAKKEMDEKSPDDIISWENILYLTDFFKISDENFVSLLGGEPTLHPQFTDIVLYLIERDMKVNIFTSGIMSDEKLEEMKKYLTKVSPEQLSFVCNLNNPEQTNTPKGELEKVHKFLSVMGPWTEPGFNIYRTDFEIDFIFDLLVRYGMHHGLRLGIASPVPGYDNIFIHPNDIKKVIDRLYSYRELFDRFQLGPGLDCGFPLCSFNDEQLGWIFRTTGQIEFGCGPALDITPDLEIYSCFPMSGYHRRSIFEFDNMNQVSEHFGKLHQQIRNEIAGIYDECQDCAYMKTMRCAGGGVCQILRHMVKEAPVRLQEIEDGLSKYSLTV
jgi:cyclic pyranopterin phosphate synthase